MKLSVWAGSQRYSERHSDRVTHHSFSFGQHYDPANVVFGPMRALDDHHLAWGAGFDEHPHSDIELVTWVVHGQLVHTDATGGRSLLPAGTVHVQSAGTGIRHGEHADTSPEPTRFVQTWLVPDDPGEPPARFSASGMDTSTLHPVAGDGAQVPVGTAGATMWFGRLRPGTSHELPVCASHHLFMVNGSAHLVAPGDPGRTLEAGDAVRVVDADETEMVLTVPSTTAVPAEVLLWTFRRPA